mmetsp:Transcript_57587/g.166687  ORF Transcript_57587/g.166687 Transcript_57587/m.166687 type:complete len:266 (-) Transcript_57587:3-800(-)
MEASGSVKARSQQALRQKLVATSGRKRKQKPALDTAYKTVHGDMTMMMPGSACGTPGNPDRSSNDAPQVMAVTPNSHTGSIRSVTSVSGKFAPRARVTNARSQLNNKGISILASLRSFTMNTCITRYKLKRHIPPHITLMKVRAMETRRAASNRSTISSTSGESSAASPRGSRRGWEPSASHTSEQTARKPPAPRSKRRSFNANRGSTRIVLATAATKSARLTGLMTPRAPILGKSARSSVSPRGRGLCGTAKACHPSAVLNQKP